MESNATERSASYIDDEDDRWDYFVIYEKVGKQSSGDGVVSHYFAGMTTVYRYYAYPQKTRPRISQVLILVS